MDVNTIVQLVNGCGFPIAACCAMGWFIVWNKKQSNESRKYNYEQLENAIANNTAVVKELCEFLKMKGMS